MAETEDCEILWNELIQSFQDTFDQMYTEIEHLVCS